MFPTISFFTDFILLVLSIITIYWIFNNINTGVNDAGLTSEEVNYREMANLEDNIFFKFEYLFTGMIACLIWKILEIV